MSKNSKSLRVKLIVNPGAGNASDADNNLKLVTGFLKKNGLKADVSQAKPKGKATPIARKAIKDGYKVVIAMGGDGTIEAVMRGMVGSKVPLGIIPTGIENNIAKSLGIPINLEDACALIASKKTRKLDVGEVKTGKGKSFPFFEMAGIGLSAAMYPIAAKEIAGETSVPQDVVPDPSQKESRPKVILTLDDNTKIEVDALLVMVSNTSVFGKKFLLTPNASLMDGFLDISVYQNFSKTELNGYHASMMNGGYSGDGKVLRYQARKLKVRTLPRLKVTADGIEQGKGTVTIKMRSGALRVIAAKKSQEVEIPTIDEVIPVPARDEVTPDPARDEVAPDLMQPSRFKPETQDEVENLPEPDTVTKESAPKEEV